MGYKFFIGVASFGLFSELLQVPAASDTQSLLTIAEHLTLSGALIIGVVVLWRSNQKKDDLVLKTTEQVTTALAAAAASNIELRRANDVLVQQVLNLKSVIEDWKRGAKA